MTWEKLGNWVGRRGWLVVTGLLIGASLCAFLIRRKLEIWPQETKWRVEPFSDQTSGGRSRLVQFRKDGRTVLTEFVLSDDPTRSAGLALHPAQTSFQDGSGCDVLQIEYRTVTKDPLRIQIQLDDPERPHSEDLLSKRFLFYELPPATRWQRTRIPLSAFQTPDWWFRYNHVPPGQIPAPNFGRVLKVGFCESEFTAPWKTVGIELRSLSLEGSWWPTLLLAFLIPLPWLFHRTSFSKAKARPFGHPLPLPARDETEFERVTHYLAEKYPDAELTLAVLARETGIPEGRVSSVLEKRTGLRFKPYLNQVRIDQAARLLTETDLTVAEIAYQVGYSNTTHFNRVFKSLKQIVPSEYRWASRKEEA